MQAKIFVIPLAMMVIFFSGCTLPGQQTTTNTGYGQGLEIEYFGAEHDYVIGGDSAESIVVKVRNNGDQDIQSITAKPYLLAWSGFSGNPTTPCVTPLLKPNPELERLGSPCTMKWTVTTPSVTKQESFRAGVRVEYAYTTTATAKVYALTANKYAGLRERGVDVRSIQEPTTTQGPIQIEILVDNVLIYGSGNNRLPVTLRFTNTGGTTGRGYPKGSGDREYVVESVDVDASSGVTGISADTSQCNDVRMRQGSTGDCVMTLTVGANNNAEELEVPIKVTAHYTYVTEQETSIIVNPDLSSSGSGASGSGSGTGAGTSRNP